QLSEQGVRAALEVISRSVVVGALVIFLIWIDPISAVLAFAIFGGSYGAIFYCTRRYLRRIGGESVVVGGERLRAVNEALGGLKDLRTTAREASAHARFKEPSRRSSEIQPAFLAISGLRRYALEAIVIGGLVLVASTSAGSENGTGTRALGGAYAFAG